MPNTAPHGTRSKRLSCDHRRRAAKSFLGRRKIKMHRAVKIARFGKITGSAQQHRRMAIMTAGMHPLLRTRGMRKIGRLNI
jgi:hypothetical protein